MTTVSNTDLWFRRFRPAERPAARLFCFPHAGGSATYFFPVAKAMPAGVEVVAVQYPGRQDRRGEPCITDLRTMADAVAARLDDLLGVPFALFGHSMGATVAYEVALRLEKGGRDPHAVFASGRRAPSRFRDERVHLRSDDGLLEEMKALGGTDPRMFDDEMIRAMLPSLRADYRAVETYRGDPGEKLTCPLVVLTGDADPHVSDDEARAWREHTTGRFELLRYPGGHFFLNDHVSAVLAAISGRLPL
ncbi:thioesterase II family protein [Actinoplanes sp. NPDC051343]|uniref:thioesterase II family protein n=1 Tax=Actinoplanes sp. NPDC051343 TaxID=3363906 RepID=UPI0037A7A596